MTPPLAHELVPPAGPEPRRTAWVLHGIFGSRRNWRGFARAFVQRFPGWRLLLVDLRNHGGSHGLPPPHTVAVCGADLERLAVSAGPADALIGHSFSVKVLLLHAARAASLPSSVWLLDGPAGAEEGAEHSEVARMLGVLRGMPRILPARTTVTHALRGLGFSAELAIWMASNLEPHPDGGMRWHFDLDAVAEMLADYWRVDAWDALIAAGPRTRFHVVVGTRSDRFTPEALGRLAALAAQGTLALHTLDAGHWLHADDPSGLLDVMAATFGVPIP